MGIRILRKTETTVSPGSVAPVEPEDLSVSSEDPLEALLDLESDDEFGGQILDVPENSQGTRVRLADWTAKDFSTIYIRFRPHLERHARRYLNNPSQVDEVVQDAFLYLMVSLPELDSEIGVLRFLKWKTRLLALDVIRASGRAYINSIDDIPEPVSKDPEVSSFLEQQDDAAVVRLALAKLNPRHREVLIASIYEEKSTAQIAQQVGLSENATRQLLLRARNAFKNALIGDVDTTGMSASAILSVAARKAAAEGKRIGASALTLIALVVMSLSFWPSLNSPEQETATGPAPSPSSSASLPEPSPDVSQTPSANPEEVPKDASKVPAESGEKPQDPTKAPTPSQNSVITDSLSESSLSELFDTTSKAQLFVQDEKLTLTATNGLTVEFIFNQTSSDPFRQVLAILQIDGQDFMVYPDSTDLVRAIDPSGYETLVYFGTMNVLFDEDGKIWSESDLAKATLRIDVILEKNGIDVKEALLTVISKG